MAKLTKTAVDNLKAPEKGEAVLWCGELKGFGVRAQPGGRKVYQIRYRNAAGKDRRMVIGRCSDMAPEKARELARKFFTQVAEGRDPMAERRPEPAPEQARKPTVEALFQAYVANMREKGQASATEVQRALLKAKNNAADALGRHKEAGTVTIGQIVDYVASLYQNGTKGAADKHRSYISSAFAWALASANDYRVTNRMDWGISVNPAADIARDAKATKARDRALDAGEMRKFWKATDPDAGHFTPVMCTLYRMLMLCGQRVQETLRLEGSELDFSKGLWHMPAHKTKTKKYPHVIPLPRHMIAELKALVAERGQGYLFVDLPAEPVPDAERSPYLYTSVNHALNRWFKKSDANLERFQPRDLRRTWKSRTGEAGIDRFTRDLIQQHARNDTGSKHYDRYQYLEEKRAAMKKWGDWLDAVVFAPKPTLVRTTLPAAPLQPAMAA